MRARTMMLVAALVLGAAAPVAAQGSVSRPEPLEVGAVAPDFELPGATRYGVLRDPVRLGDFKGKTVVVAFFPKARTRGCTIQMHTYRDRYAELFRGGREIVLIAISADPVEELAAWARDDEFPFLMASDVGLEVAGKYGAQSGRPGIAARNLFVIGPDGRIAYRAAPFREIDPQAYEELAAAIDRLVPKAAIEAGD